MEKNNTLIYFQFFIIAILLAFVLFRKPIDPRPDYLPLVEQIIEQEASKIDGLKDSLGHLEVKASYMIEEIKKLKIEIYALDSIHNAIVDLPELDKSGKRAKNK